MKHIALANHKGGCAKTTTALNVGVTLAMTGSRVLMVDLDPQGNLSAALSADLEELERSRKTTYRLMLDEKADYSTYIRESGVQLSCWAATAYRREKSRITKRRSCKLFVFNTDIG